MKFQIELQFDCGLSWPKIEFASDVSLSETVINEYKKNIIVSGEFTNSLAFLNSNKSEKETILDPQGKIVRDQVVSIKKIWVEDILLDLNLFGPYINYKPVYHRGYINYCNLHNIDIKENLQVYDLYFNGSWEINVQQPFWHWYADIRLKNAVSHMSKQDAELYLGNSSGEYQDLIDKLVWLLNV